MLHNNTFYYSHDYTCDTSITYTHSPTRSEIVLAFTSEDPDFGTEEMTYGTDGEETFANLARELRDEITAYLDWVDSSSFREQQGSAEEYDADYYGEYTRTSLYAFEAALNDYLKTVEAVLTQLDKGGDA